MFIAPYSTSTVRIPDEILPGNMTSDTPLEFDIVPAWGPDLARLKSIVKAGDDMIAEDWSPAMQLSTIKALEDNTGLRVFANTVDRIRNLWIPAAMARRAGLVDPTSKGEENFQITNGLDFSRVAGSEKLMSIGLFIAYQITSLNNAQDIDPRFFARPSGFGGRVTSRRKTTAAKSARSTSRRRGTAAVKALTASPQPGTSDPSQSPSGAQPKSA